MINTAVILAGRKEKFFDIPVSLIEIEPGVNLYDRTLAILKEYGIEKIVLVTGFRKELFEPSTEVIHVHNERYVHTASMASLALAAPFIQEDFLLIESDMIYEKIVVEQLCATTHKNCFSIARESGNGDEAFVETDGRAVLKISKDLHQMNKVDGEMVGVTRISLETYKKMLQKWAFNSNLKLNYEYLLMDCAEKHERDYIHFRNLIWGEIDHQKDLDHVIQKLYPKLKRKENPFDYLNIRSHMRTIFPQKEISETNLEVEQIGGLTNKNFKITLDQEQYVLRIPGNGTAGMIERKNEEVNSFLSCQMGISPEILYFNDETGIKLTRFIDGAETLNASTIQRYETILQISSIFKMLHHSAVRFNADFNVFQEIIKYERLLEEAGGTMYEGYDLIRTAVFQLADRLNELGVVLAPCHNDLVAENWIESATGKIYLIDWEYSGINDPMWDFAALFLESEFTAENRELMLETYFGRPANEVETEKIMIYQILMDLLWSIWTCIKEAKGDDFGCYGINRFNRSLEQMREWECRRTH